MAGTRYGGRRYGADDADDDAEAHSPHGLKETTGMALRDAGLWLIDLIANPKHMGLSLPVSLPPGDMDALRSALDKGLAWAAAKGAEVRGLGLVYHANSDGVLKGYAFTGFLTPGGGRRFQARFHTAMPGGPKGQTEWLAKDTSGPIPTGERYIVTDTESKAEHQSGKSTYWVRKSQVVVYYAERT